MSAAALGSARPVSKRWHRSQPLGLGRAFHVLVCSARLACSRNHCALDNAKRTCQNQTGSREFSLPERAGRWLRYFNGPGLSSPERRPGEGTPRLPVRLRGGFRTSSKGARIMTPDETEPAADRPRRAQAYRTRMRAERDRQIVGSHGPASPCKRIDPRTGEIIEVIARSTKTPTRRIR
jgi:hypothetical protein